MMIVPHLTLLLSYWSGEDLLSRVMSMNLHCYCTWESMTSLSDFDTDYKYTVCLTGIFLFTVLFDVFSHKLKVNRKVLAFT